METNNKITEDRVIGSSGLSIGTHLALESLFSSQFELYDDKREFNKINVKKYDKHIFNIYTIVRNILNSYTDKDKVKIIQKSKFSYVFKQELDILSGIYMNVKCDPVLFYPNYDKLYVAYNINKTEIDTSTYKLHLVIKSFLNDIDKKIGIECINDKKSYKLKKLEGQNLITTHIGIDLFNSGNLSLLESHTGKLLTRSEFNKRYRSFGEVKLDYLPWDELIYFLMGDHVFVKGVGIKYKKQFINISRTNNWTIKTEPSLIRTVLRRDELLRDYVQKFKYQY